MDDVEEPIKSQSQPTGLVVRAADGRLFFITDEQAEKAAIRETGLYVAYLAATHHSPQAPIQPQMMNCGSVKAWLDRNNPDQPLWRRVCLQYFDECV